MRNTIENLIGIALKYPINMGKNGHLDKTDSFYMDMVYLLIYSGF